MSCIDLQNVPLLAAGRIRMYFLLNVSHCKSILANVVLSAIFFLHSQEVFSVLGSTVIIHVTLVGIRVWWNLFGVCNGMPSIHSQVKNLVL